jgi:hypothetical protein
MVLTKLRVLKRQVKNSEYDDDEVWIGFQMNLSTVVFPS